MRQVVLPEAFCVGLKLARTESHRVQLKQEDSSSTGSVKILGRKLRQTGYLW
jgi:hypothetical protein